MRVLDTEIPDLKIIEPTVYEHERGFFLRLIIPLNLKELLASSLSFVNQMNLFQKKA
jgi:dTDP-4-dehydrorhamnose 3,5-epimerase-like enzyme